MDIWLTLALFAGGMVAGGLSAVAGGSGFMTFPLLLASGLSPLVANVTNFMALTPSNMVALVAYRDELHELRGELKTHLTIALCGGLLGSALLVWLGESNFERFIPWLMLTATFLFAAGGWLRTRLDRLARGSAGIHQRWVYGLEFVLMVYGGYFGAGIGIIILASLAIAGQTSLHLANAQKNAMISVMSIAGIGIFIWSGHIAWLNGLPMLAGVVLGGYLSIGLVKKLPQRVVRLGVLAWAVVLTIYTFWKYG